MKQKILFLLFCLASLQTSAQTIVDPNGFPVLSSPTLNNWAIYTREDGVNRKVLPTAIRNLMMPIVRQPADITYTPAPTGNPNDRGSFVRTSLGRIYFIDGLGNSLQTNAPYANATIADNDIHAGVNCVPVGGWYRLSNANTLGLPPGTLRQRVYGSATPCTNTPNGISPGQTRVVGGGGVLKVNGDPDTNPYAKAQDQYYEASVAWDTLNKAMYVYRASDPLGSRWDVFEGASVDTRVDTAYIQNDTLKLFVLNVGPDTIQDTIKVPLVFPDVIETGLASPLPAVGPPGSVDIKTIDLNGNVALYFSDGDDWLGGFEIPGIKNVDSLMIAPDEVDNVHLGIGVGGIYKGSGTIPEETIAELSSGSFLAFQWSNETDAISAYDDEGKVYFTSKNGLNSTQTGNTGWTTSTPSHTIEIVDEGGVGDPDDGIFRIQDNSSSPKGIQYTAEYPTILENDRSIPDVGLVKQLVSDSLGTISSDALGAGFVNGGGIGTIPANTTATYEGQPISLKTGEYVFGLPTIGFVGDNESGATGGMTLRYSADDVLYAVNFFSKDPTSETNFDVQPDNVNYSTRQLNESVESALIVIRNGPGLYQINDQRATKRGFEYVAKYPAIKANNRSIPDVELVREMIADSVVANTALGIGFTNGGGSGTIPDGTAASGTIGTWQRRMLFNTPSYFESEQGDGFNCFGIESYNTSTEQTWFLGNTDDDPLTLTMIGRNFSGTTYGAMGIGSSGIEFRSDLNASFLSGYAGISLTSSANTFTDNTGNHEGLEYASDYSATIKANDRSIPDVGTVRQMIGDSVGNSGHIIREEGSNLTQRPYLNFVGSTATAADNSGTNSTNVTFDSDVNALASNSTSGLWTRTGSGTGAARSLATFGEGLGVFNQDGVSGNPTFFIQDDLAAVEALSTGFAVKVADGNWNNRSIAAGTNISVTNADGVGGNPTISTTFGPIFTQTADKTVTNTVTQTSILGTGVGSKTLSANTLTAGKSVRLKVTGLYSTPATPGNMIVRLKLGSTTIASVTTSALNGGAASDYFDFETVITCRTTGSSGTVMSNGIVSYQGASGPIFDAVNNGGSTATINTTTSQAIDVTVEWDTADAGKIVKTTTCIIETL